MKWIGDHERRYYFNLCCHKTSWGNVKVFEEQRKLEQRLAATKYQWMTHSQLAQSYANDYEIVDALVASKKADNTMWRPHPEMPTLLKAIQYKCVIEDSQTDSVARILDQRITLEADRQADHTADRGCLGPQQQLLPPGQCRSQYPCRATWSSSAR